MKINRSTIIAILTITTAASIINVSKTYSEYIGKVKPLLAEYMYQKVVAQVVPVMGNDNAIIGDNKSISQIVLGEMMHILPILEYYQRDSISIAESGMEDDLTTYEMILKDQSHYENFIDAEGNLVEEESTILSTTMAEDMDALKDPANLISKYYIVDRTANVDTSLFSAEAFMAKDMKLKENADGPQILIYHTHSQEAFTDSVAGDSSTSIVGVGGYLTELLEGYGIEVLHHEGVYDLIDGKLDRSKAYEYALGNVVEILEENPSIELVIDLHRDGVPETTHLVTKINGKTTAQIMFFNGLSSTLSNGDISSLQNPYILDNLALSFQMQYAANEMYPGFTRRIYLKSYRYNMHVLPKTMLIEAGAQTNSVEEMMNAMEVLSEILVSVVK